MIKWFDTRGACFSSIAHMKHAHWLIFLGLVIAFVSVSNVTSIKCYQCKEPDPRCRDPFQNDTAFFKPCPANATKCRKYKWEIGDGHTYFERGCAVHGEVSRREGRNCIERVGTYKTRMWYCICDNKDGCNSATKLSQSSFHQSAHLLLAIVVAMFTSLCSA